MQKIKINLKHCYGIKELKADFDFSNKRSFVIYAPNGVMKTSFAKTFQDLSTSSKSEDRIYKGRETTREIIDQNGNELIPEQIFVIEPYNQEYKSSRISTLLVNKELKKEYDEIHQEINEKKENLIKELQSHSSLKKELEETLSDAITHDPKKIFVSLNRLRAEVLENKSSTLEKIIYPIIFNEKVLAEIKSEDFIKKLKDYMDIYDQLISSSTFFKKGVFNHNNAADISKSLKDNGYFQANHSVTINTQNGQQIIKNESDLEQCIQKEKDSILEDPVLAKSFEAIDKKLTKNKDVKSFRDYLDQNRAILPELDNLERFKQKLWVAYLTKSISSFSDLMKTYDKGKENIDRIIKKAKQEVTKWKRVIDIFNYRFSVPFIVKIKNQEEVILEEEAPNITFEFKDGKNSDQIPVDESELLKVLSNGEKRALYILNIIFEVEARKEENQETLFIVDDIADSFDYKNKYAIIEYLKEISEIEYFYQVLLSHNFDFYRTISGRFDLKRKNKLHTVKSENRIVLKEECYQNNPFRDWKDNLSNNNEKLIALIPFLRNLSEYRGDEASCNSLTSLLHIKPNTDNLKISDLETIIKTVLQDQGSLSLDNQEQKVKIAIYRTADDILDKTEEQIELETKIVLSIAIRLKTEEFLIKEINDENFVNQISKNQTYHLIDKFKQLSDSQIETIKLLEQVNLMTPENIHLNSFMYEPILDMSNEHLKQLYNNISSLPSPPDQYWQKLNFL